MREKLFDAFAKVLEQDEHKVSINELIDAALEVLRENG